MDHLKYPIGKYVEQPFSEEQLKEWLLDIQTLPMHVEHAVLRALTRSAGDPATTTAPRRHHPSVPATPLYGLNFR